MLISFLISITMQKYILKSIKKFELEMWNLVYLLYMFCQLTSVFNIQYLIFNLNNLSIHCLLCRPNTSTSPFLSPARAILIARGWNQLLNFLFLPLYFSSIFLLNDLIIFYCQRMKPAPQFSFLVTSAFYIL